MVIERGPGCPPLPLTLLDGAHRRLLGRLAGVFSTKPCDSVEWSPEKQVDATPDSSPGPITPIRRTGRLETNRPRGGPVAGHVSGTSPLMPASHAVGCARPRARPSAVVRRTRRRGGAGRGLTGCARPRGPAASRLTATRAPRATPMCRSIRASAHAICTPAATLSFGSTTGSPRHPEHGSHPRRVLRRCETARSGGGWCRPHRDHRRGVGAVPGDRAPRRSCRSRRRRDRRVTAGGSSEVTPMRISSRDRAPHLCRRRLTCPSRSRYRSGDLSG